MENKGPFPLSDSIQLKQNLYILIIGNENELII